MIKQIITGLVIGIFATLVFVQYDPWVHTQLGHLFTHTLSQIFDCEVRGTVRTVNFLVPEIVFDDFSMAQKKEGKPDWHWNAKIYRSGFSWLDVIVNNAINMWAVAHDLAITSKVIDNQIAIAPHIADLLAPPDLPIPLTLDDGYIKNGSITLEHEKAHVRFLWQVNSHRIGNKSRSHFTIVGGGVSMDGVPLLEYASGKIVLDSYDDNTIELKTDCQGQLCNLSDHPTVYLHGSWNTNHGRFCVESLDKSSDINAISAVSRATSVPAAPMAIPTVAAANAGASFIPSPIIATLP